MLLARALVRGAGPRRAAAVAAAAAASTPWRGGSHRHLASAASIWAPSLLADPSPCYRCPTQRTVPAGTATPAVPRLRSMGAVPLVAAAATSAFVRQHQPMMGRASVRFYSSSKHSIVGAELIPMVNKLQEVLAVLGSDLDLPQIIVIGSQSSGKSSVLENLVGNDFLPRGAGIVTRRPLILQLNKTESGGVWGEFAHLPHERFTDFGAIRDEISRETDRVAGKSKAVSADPIILRIYSPDVLPLTLVDTPGITRVPVGDQPSNIEAQIRNMVLSFIKQKNAIILAVQPANQDIATSDAIKLAHEVDPDGTRTIGVLTKLDLMDRGTNALDILTGRAYPLRLGFVGIVNRSQEDINSNKSIQRSLQEEAEFFARHPLYSQLAAHNGTRFLAERCNQLLTAHIRDSLPELKNNLRTRIKQVKKELAEIGEAPVEATSDKRWVLLQILNQFSVAFREAIEGTRADVTSDQLHGGARIRYIFDDLYRKRLASLNPTAGLTINQYRMALRNASGPRASLFVPQGAFEVLVKKQIEQLKEPSLQCADLILSELQRITAQLETPELRQFHLLRQRIVAISSDVLRKGLAPAQKMISDLIDCELAYINTNHPDFIANNQAQLGMNSSEPIDSRTSSSHAAGQAHQENVGFFGKLFGGRKRSESLESSYSTESTNKVRLDPPPAEMTMPGDITPREQAQIRLIKELLSSYFDIARKNIQDGVAKAIWHFLVNKGREDLHKALVTGLYQEQDLDRLLLESDATKVRRSQLQAELATLKRAKEIIQRYESSSSL